MKKLKALEILKDHIIDLENMALIFEEYCMYKSRDETNKAIQELTEAIDELEALETKDTQSMTREEARKLIDKHSKKDKFGVGVIPKKVAYIIADYLPKDKK